MDHQSVEVKKLISKCRSCATGIIESFLDLGDMHLTGYFPDKNVDIPKLPLDLGKCKNCGLVQLVNVVPITELYGKEYGYESNLNDSMKLHLQQTASYLEKRFSIKENDYILDIASNDGTLLAGYKNSTRLIGIDPIINYLNDYYPKSALKISDFFSTKALEQFSVKKCKLVTSFSVFYDLDDPLQFSSNVENILTEDGIWVLEQSYLPSMFNTLGFDTICHEHLLYLTLTDLESIFARSGLRIFDAKINEVNGGSIQVYVCKVSNKSQLTNPFVSWLINWEKESNVTSYEDCLVFASKVKKFSVEFRELLISYKDRNFYIFGLGASTKGNVMLQYCNLGELISKIGEINPKKFGKFTPGTKIPIVNQSIIFDSDNSSFQNHLGIILPWHFKNSIRKSASNYLSNGGSLIVPLPFPSAI